MTSDFRLRNPGRAIDTEYDPSFDPDCDLTVENVQEAIDELCKRIIDPFANALFDKCDPLFDELPDCTIDLLLECG